MKDRNGKTLRKYHVCVINEKPSGLYSGNYNGVIVEVVEKSCWPDKSARCRYYNEMFGHIGTAPFVANSLEIIGNVRGGKHE